MKRYIKCGRSKKGYGHGGKYRYWDDPTLADKVTDVELDDAVKRNLFEDILDEMKYTEYHDRSYNALWDDFISRLTTALQDLLEYEYPEASWRTWYEDARQRFDEWYNS
jgi:hypothetical protein